MTERNFSIGILISVFISNIIMMIFSIISLFFLEEANKLESLLFFSCCILESLICILLCLFGLRLIYFKIVDYYKHYICFLLSLIIIVIGLIVMNILILLLNLEISTLFVLKIINIVFLIVICLFYIISLFTTRKYINEIKDEISSAPLNSVDDSLTSEIYNNIIKQSKDPTNNSLREEFVKLSFHSKGTKKLDISLL